MEHEVVMVFLNPLMLVEHDYEQVLLLDQEHILIIIFNYLIAMTILNLVLLSFFTAIELFLNVLELV